MNLLKHIDDIAPRQTSAGDGDAVDVGKLWRAILRGKWVVLACVLVGLLMAGYYAFRIAEPLYQKDASLILADQDPARITGFESVLAGGAGTTLNQVETELEVLTSRRLMGLVVDQLDLTQNPEFNDSLAPPGLLDRLGTRLSSLFGLSQGAETPRAPDVVRELVIGRLQRVVSVSNITGTSVIEISAVLGQRSTATQIVNTLADVYIADGLEAKRTATTGAADWLRDEVSRLQGDLQMSENDLERFIAETDLVVPEVLEGLYRQQKDLRLRIAGAQSTLEEIRDRLEAMQTAETDEARAEAAGDSGLTQILASDGSDTRFQARFESLLAQTERQAEQQQFQLNLLRNSLTRLVSDIEVQSADMLQMRQMERDTETLAQLYEHFKVRLAETASQEGLQSADARVLSYAINLGGPVAPKKGLLLLIGVILGAFTGITLVIVASVHETSFVDSQDLDRATGLPVIAELPIAPIKRRSNLVSYLSTNRVASAFSEAIRSLRTALLLSAPAADTTRGHVTMITSSVPGEGKTTTAISLATNLAFLDHKVVLIEGDIRRNLMRTYFPDVPNTGLADLLAAPEMTLDEVTHFHEDLGITVIGGGESRDNNAADLLQGTSLSRVLDRLRDEFDYILIDTPPTNLVVDSRIIANHADAVLYCVRWKGTQAEIVQDGLRLLRQAGHVPDGLVMTMLDLKKAGAYGNQARYGYHAYGGGGYYTS